INYEDFEYHKALHEKFITTVAQHEKKMLASDFSDNDVKEFVGTLVAWVLYHVSEEDQRIVVETPKKEILAEHSDLIFICACDVINKIAGFDLEKMDKADVNHVELNDSLIVEVVISGGISGYINLVFSFSFIKNLIVALMGSFSGTVDELATSALLEISHIMSINICGKIAKEKGVTCDVKPPVIVEKSTKMLSERVAIDTGEGIIEIGLSIS
ncbi:MAG: hypothetical protein LBC71_06925, partial [Oscillospiraceae bacterium]|nr:hypothetical protein [Oscillospiraceae bacterium]